MKFINLLKKELSELVNVQMLATLGIMLLIFMMMGNIMTTAINDVVEDASHPTVNISDRDNTELSKQLIEALKAADAEVNVIETEGDDYAAILADNNIKNIIIITEGFTKSIEEEKKPELLSVAKMTSAASMANISNGNVGASSLINECVRNLIAETKGIDKEELQRINSPIEITENTVVDKNWAPISIGKITAKISFQNVALPIALFVLLIMTSQSLISSVSNEKIDKTLETLLSAPVSRMSVISAKMLAAAIVALINACVMMIGFTFFVKDSITNIDQEVTDAAKQMLSTDNAFRQLGLNLSAVDYLLIGLQFFFTIMICLSISIVLGSLANDAKASQTVILPIMLLVMVPYVISILTDVNSLPTAVRIVVYAIPFTHTFMAMGNLIFGNTAIYAFGLIYQIIIFAVCMYFALRLFKSDKILTMSLNIGQKSRFKKSRSHSEE
ncbi:MAG: ABC transporter permease [Ruminococcus sp.]|nr:ABC transporter permease [Ruminococcus sp.]